MLPKNKKFNIIQTRDLRPIKTLRKNFILVKVFSNTSGPNRAAVSMSKKVDPLATGRNKIKRVIFKAIQETGFLAKKKNQDLLVIPLSSCTKATDPERVIIRELKELISKL